MAKMARLEEQGKLTEAGRRAFAARTPERTGVYSFERNEAAQFTAEQERALRANEAAAAFFDAQPPWYRRTATHWVISAKRDETRQRRLQTLIDDSAHGRAIAPLQRPVAPAQHTAKKKAKAKPRARTARRRGVPPRH